MYTASSHQPLAGYGASVIIDGAVFALIGWRLWKNSRIASVAGLLLMLLEIADKLLNHAKTFNFLTIVLLLAILNSVRGAFAVHAQTEREKLGSAASAPQPLG